MALIKLLAFRLTNNKDDVNLITYFLKKLVFGAVEKSISTPGVLLRVVEDVMDSLWFITLFIVSYESEQRRRT